MNWALMRPAMSSAGYFWLSEKQGKGYGQNMRLLKERAIFVVVQIQIPGGTHSKLRSWLDK